MGTVLEGQGQPSTFRGKKERQEGKKAGLAEEVVPDRATLPMEPGGTPSSTVLQHPPAWSQGRSAALSSLLAPGRQTATAAAGGPCKCGCVVAHQVSPQVLL